LRRSESGKYSNIDCVFTNKVSKYTFLFKPELKYEIYDLKLGMYVLILL